MDVSELILLNSDKVRRDSNLMAFYIETFQKQFGYAPKCSGCTFNSDWRKLISHLNKGEKSLPLTINKKTMENNFKLKKLQHKIFAYRIDKKTFRLYDNKFTNDFVKNFLTYGTEQEIEERKKLFSVLPEEEKEVVLEPVIVQEKVKEITENPKKETVVEKPKRGRKKTK